MNLSKVLVSPSRNGYCDPSFTYTSPVIHSDTSNSTNPLKDRFEMTKPNVENSTTIILDSTSDHASLLSKRHHSDHVAETGHDGETFKKSRYLVSAIKLHTTDTSKSKLKPTHASDVDEVYNTGMLEGRTLKQYAFAYVNFNNAVACNSIDPQRSHLRKSFLRAFHAYSKASERRNGTKLKISQYIVNFDTVTMMTVGHLVNPTKVPPSIVSTMSQTTKTRQPNATSLRKSVVLVKLSRAALSATLPSNSIVSDLSGPTRTINSVFNSTSAPQISTTSNIANIACYDTIVDTGASAHVVKSTLLATNIRAVTNRHVALGDNSIKLIITDICDLGILTDVMVVPNISLNLISGSQLDKQGYTLKFANGKGTIRKGSHVITCTLHNDLYYCNLTDFLVKPQDTTRSNFVQPNTKTLEVETVRNPIPTVIDRLITPASKPQLKPQRTISTSKDLELLHKRFGHANVESIVKGLKDQTIKGYDVTAKRSLNGKFALLNGKCDCCMQSKSHLPSFPNASTIKGSAPGQYVVCDIQGPFSIESIGGERYVLTYTDYYTRHSWTYLLTQKSEAINHLKYLVEVVFKAARIELRHYHSDGAGELAGTETRNYLERVVHATISTSEVYTPQRNAIAERKFRTLGEMAKAMLYDSSLPKTFWGYAYLNATYLRNRVPITTCDGITKTPYELWTGHTPNIRHLRRWGCKCYAHVPKAKRAKDFTYKCSIGYLVGYTDENSYLIYVPLDRKVIKPTVAVVFDEQVPEPRNTYFDELTKYDFTEVNDSEVSDDPKYYERTLVGQRYFDPDDNMFYVTTRIAVTRDVHRHIVAYRVPLLANDKLSRKEEELPVHVADVVRMIAESRNYESHLKAMSDLLRSSPDEETDRSPSPLVKPRSRQRLISTVKKAKPTSTSTHSDTPLASWEEPNTSVSNRYHENLKRSRKQRLPLNVRELGNVGNNCTTVTHDDKVYDDIYIASVVKELDDTPKNYKAAMKSTQATQWQSAIDAEIKSLLDLKTWVVVDTPKDGRKLKTCAFIFKKKFTGSEIKYKARLVAHGYRQIFGLDYWETYAPVSQTTSIRTILALAANNNMKIHQMDIDTAFLNADLKEDIYMSAPLGITLPEGKCLLLKKSLYGLKQSPRNFNLDLNSHIISMGFKRTVSDACVYTHKVNNNDVIISVYVDDLIIACTDTNTIIAVKEQIAQRYKVKDMGEMDWYLGMRYTRCNDTGMITLDQSKYAQDILDRFTGYYKPHAYRDIPMMGNSVLPIWTNEYNEKLTEEQLVQISSFPYRQVVGSLLYLAVWTRPDLQYAVITVAKHSHHPTLESISACKWLLEYLNCTKDRSLQFHKGNNTLSGFVDSSFGDDLETRKSTCGNIIYLGTSPISWESFIPKTTVALSTAEAEYTAAHYCAKNMCAHNNFLTELGYPQDNILIFEDSQSAIHMAIQVASTHRTKHIAIHIHHLRDLIEKRFIDLVYISTDIQIADILTKPLPYQKFSQHMDQLFGIPPTKQLKEYLRVINLQRQSGIQPPMYKNHQVHNSDDEEEETNSEGCLQDELVQQSACTHNMCYLTRLYI